MTRDAEVVKLKQLRRFIISNLNRLYPTPLQIVTLFRVMISFDEHYDMSLLQKDVAYLKQKGYVEFVDDSFGGFPSFKDKYVGLTAEGKEIADRVQLDEALEI